MELFIVYAPDGEAFEVTPDKAKELVVQHGWSLDVSHDGAIKITAPLPTKERVFINLPVPPVVEKVEPAPVPDEPKPTPVAVNEQPDEIKPIVLPSAPVKPSKIPIAANLRPTE